MATRWRELFTALGVSWVDSGRNTARGWISIACPWCGDDPSEHLGVNEEGGHYRCLRNEQHKGRSPYWLLKGLGVHPRDWEDLLRAHGGGGRPRVAPVTKPQPIGGPAYRWSQFTPAGDSRDALDYLHGRQFPDPESTCRRFDLRVGTGRWARRLWFKLTDLAGNVTGFTGRALDDWRSPRYFTEAPEPYLYLPKPVNHQHRLALGVEGPMDALRIADVAERRRNLLVFGLCGLSATGGRRLQLQQIARMVPRFFIALDATVRVPDAQRLMNEIRIIPAIGKVSRLPMLPDIDDPGEMSNTNVERWLSTL
jgi:hypothetical protein